MSTIDPRQQYRVLKQEQQTWQEKKLNAEQDLLISAKHPEFYNAAFLAEIREDAATASDHVQRIAGLLATLEKDPTVRQMLVRELGLASGALTWEPVLRSFAEIEEKTVPWLWFPFIPLGRLTILEGDPGQGKSWFSLAVATCVSLGGWLELMPDEESWTTPAGVVYVTCEDDPEDTIKKRLRILQADQTKIHHLTGKAKSGSPEIAVTLADLSILAQAIDATNAKLLIIDPIQAYLPHGADMNKAEQVRPLLSKLQRLAKEKNVAVLIVRHLAKGSKDHALYKGMGSIDFTAAARSVLVCAERKELEESSTPVDGRPAQLIRRKFAVAQVKNNISARGPAVEFELQRDAFLWVGTADVTADQLLAPSMGTAASGTSASLTVQEAKTFLLTVLNGGTVDVATVKKQARQAGIDTGALHSAKAELRIETRADEAGWSWFLPGKYHAH